MSPSDLPWPAADRLPAGHGQPAASGQPVAAVPQREVATLYDEVGGHPVFDGIVHRFYQRVRDDPVLRPLYPEEDLTAAEVRLRMFLEQYWGGPRTYSEQRGHPRLRMRHAPFAIGRAEHDAWLAAMREAVDAAHLTPDQDARLWAYLVIAADSMINSAH